MKQKNKIPKGWKELSLSNIGNFDKGNGISKDDICDKGLPCIRYGEIYTKYDFKVNNFNSFISKAISKTSKEIFKGDILFTGSGETSEEIAKSVACIHDGVAYAGGDIIIFKFIDKKQNSLFYSYSLNTICRKQINRLAKGHSVVHIYPEDLKNIKILIPPIQEQEKIVEILETWDNCIELTTKLIEQKELQKKYLMQKLLTGKIRLKGFKDKWEKLELQTIVKKISTGLNPRDNFILNNNGTNFYVTIKNFENGNLHLDDNCDKIDDNAISLIQKRSDLQKDDILFSSIGRIGDCYLVKEKPKNWNINESVFSIRPNNKIVLPIYLFNIFYSNYVQCQINKNITGSTLKSIKTEQLKKIIIPLPSDLKEQKLIANILTKADEEMGLLKQKLEKLKEQKKGLMQKLLTGKIRTIN